MKSRWLSLMSLALVAILFGAGALTPRAAIAIGDSANLPDYGKGTLTFLGLIRDGKFDDAHAYFSDEVSKMINAEQLGEIWKGLQDKAGPFESFGTPAVMAIEKTHAADVPVRFQNMEFTLRVVWDEEGAIAGFRIIDAKDRTGGSSSGAAAPRPPTMAQSAPAPAPAAAPAAALAAAPAPAAAAPAKPPSSATSMAPGSEFLGHWEGNVDTPMTKLPIKVDLARQDTTWTGTMDSPQQGVNGIPLADIHVHGNEAQFAIKGIPGNPLFKGKLEAGKITGTLVQNGVEMPFTLSREKLAEPNRPQEPKPPFPYKEETVTYTNGDIKLEGTLTIPKGKGPFAAALLITGSGAQNRNEEILGHKPFLVLADYLTRGGIAVLRVDDRGIGGSTGRSSRLTSADFAQDVRKGVEFLHSRPEIDPKKIGLIGHSEGGFIAPMVAADSKDVAFIVMMAGTGVPGDEIIERQTELIGRANGMKGDSLANALRDQREMLDLAKSNVDSVAIRDIMWKKAAAQMAGGQDVEKLTPEQKAQLDPLVDRQLAQLISPWFRYFLATDPRPFLRKVHVPVLALNGALDMQVDPDQNLPEIKKALEETGNKDVTVQKLAGLNHLFQKATTGSPNEYATIEETLNPLALQIIRDWIQARFGKK